MRLLIVEDEQYTRDSLLELIQYKEMGVTDVQTACNGVSAYAIAAEAMPDILLCDIRMPRMDGLELARLLREQSNQLKIIFISGYADKEYLKKAISLQATGYVEKPIDIEELKTLLRKAAGQVLAEREEQQAEQKKTVPGKVKSLVRQRLAAELTRVPVDVAALRGSYGQAYWTWPDVGSYLAACARFRWRGGMDYPAIENRLQHASALCSARLSDALGEDNVLCGALSQECVALVLRMDGCRASSPAELLTGLHGTLSGGQSDGQVYIGYGKIQSLLTAIPQGFLQAANAADWQQFIGASGARAYQPPGISEDSMRPGRVLESLVGGDPARARGEILALDESLRKRRCADLQEVRAHYGQLLGACVAAEQMISGEPPSLNPADVLQRLDTLAEITRFLLSRIDNIFPEIALPKDIHPKVAHAITYIRANLADPMLSIQSIAAHLSLTENYLSALYKKETRKTINQSITDARIERAKRLLEQDLKLYEVSRLAGYQDPNYFSVVFKKQTGVSPSTYRQSTRAKGSVQ